MIHILHYNWLFIVVRCLEALLLCSEAQTGGGRELSAFNVARVRGVGCEMLSSVNKSSQEMLFISKHPLWELGYQVLVYRRELEIPLSSHSADRSTEVRLAFFLFVCMVIFFDALSRSAETRFGFLHSRRVCVLKGRLAPWAQAFEKEAILLNTSEGWDSNKTQSHRWGL